MVLMTIIVMWLCWKWQQNCDDDDDGDDSGGGEHDCDSNDDDDNGEEESKTESQICFKRRLSSMSALI